MSMLLIKRLARSLWRTKLRLSAVIFMIAIAVFSGIAFGAYANSATTLYEDIYADDDNGVNLPDVWVENVGGDYWNGSTSNNLCHSISNQWPENHPALDKCEPRLKIPGQFHSDNSNLGNIPAIWHGIGEGEVDKVWIPNHDCCSGKIASKQNEIVIDKHAVSGLNLSLGSVVEISAGAGYTMEFTVVGIGFHSNHLYFGPEDSLVPATDGTFVTGYMTAEGLEALANLSSGDSNLLLLDVIGTPEMVMGDPDNDPSGFIPLGEEIRNIVTENDNSSMVVYGQSAVYSVELLRADAEGAVKSYPVITGMIGVVAGITIFLSLQRLIQSQAREIAILRTLGVSRTAIMPGYIIAPILIGIVGCSIGVLSGVLWGAPAMVEMYEDILGVPIINPDVSTSMVMQNVYIAMTIVFLSGLRPAWQASRLQPLDILRGQHEVRLSSRGLQRLTSKFPATVGLTIRSSVRKPVRLSFTFLAVGLSMLIFGSMIIMMDSIEDIFLSGVKEQQSWDAQVVGDDQAIIEWAEANGATYEQMIIFPGSPGGDNRQLTAYGLDTVAEEGESMYLIHLSAGEIPSSGAATPEILIDEGINHFLGWDIGETHSIDFGTKTVEVKITGFTSGDISRSVYFHRADLAEVLGFDSTIVMLQFSGENGVNDELVKNASSITLRTDSIESFEVLMEQQQGIYYAIEGLGILIAVAVLFNTLIMNLAERDKELATLRVLGASKNRLGLMLFGEHLVIGLIGGVLGCLFSIVGVNLLISSFAQWGFFFAIKASMSSIFILIAIVAGISISLTPIGMWRIHKMDLVEKVKEFSQ